MQRHLVRDEIHPPKPEYVHHRAIPKTRFVRVLPSDELPEKNWDIVKLIIIATVVTLLTTLPLVIVKSKSHSFPSIMAAKLPKLQLSLLQPHPKNFVYVKLPAQQRNDFTELVAYLADIIRTTKNDTIPADELAYTIVSESIAADYDPLFVASLILAESSFKRHARSSIGALGLMQIRPSTGKYISSIYGVKWSGPDRLRDPQYNIQLGIAYLKYLQQMFNGNMMNALIAYNWGPGNMMQVLQRRKTRIPLECLTYGRKILKNHSIWRGKLTAQLLKYEHLNDSLAKG